MKYKLMLGLIAGLICISLISAELLVGGITPRDTNLKSSLPTEVKERLDDEYRNLKWDDNVQFIDDKIAKGNLKWEWYNGTGWVGREKVLTLWVDYESESFVCDEDYDGLCLSGHNIPLEEFIEIKMKSVADKFFLKTYKRLPDVQNVNVTDVGEKTIDIKPGVIRVP